MCKRQSMFDGIRGLDWSRDSAHHWVFSARASRFPKVLPLTHHQIAVMEVQLVACSDINLAVSELQVYLIWLARYEHALEDLSLYFIQSKCSVVGSFMNVNILSTSVHHVRWQSASRYHRREATKDRISPMQAHDLVPGRTLIQVLKIFIPTKFWLKAQVSRNYSISPSFRLDWAWSVSWWS